MPNHWDPQWYALKVKRCVKRWVQRLGLVSLQERLEENFTYLSMTLSLYCSTVINIIQENSSKGDTYHIHMRGVSPRNFQATQKYQCRFFVTQKYQLHMNIKCPEKMEMEMTIASSESRNIRLTIFDAKKYHGHNCSSIRPKNTGLQQCS